MQKKIYNTRRKKRNVILKSFLLIFGTMFLISLAPALTINAGECETINLNTTGNLYWTVSGNSSSMEGLNITYDIFSDHTNVTMCLNPMFKEDIFTIIFIEEQTKEIVVEVSSGGGGEGGSSRTIYRDRYINQTEEVIVTETIPCSEKELEEEIRNHKKIWIILLSLFLFCSIILSVYLIIKRNW